MSAIPTVKIRAGDSFGIINLCDFDPDQHKVWVDEAELEATVAYHPVEVEAVYESESIPESALRVTVEGAPVELTFYPPSVNSSTCGPSASMVCPPDSALLFTADGILIENPSGTFSHAPLDPPSEETITEPLATPEAPAPEPSKQYRPGQFTPKRGPGRPRKA